MARRPRLTVSNLIFHVMARGNHRETTFCDSSDYRAYLNRLERYQRRYRVRLYAYCLMPNHVHFLIRTFDVPLGKFMQATQQSYTQRYNRRHATVGHLFQGRYKAILCERDDYLVALLRYIHLNPVRAGLVERPEEYEYSGHVAYLRGEPSALLEPTPLLDLLGGPEGYRRLLREDRDDPVPMGSMDVGAQGLELEGSGPATGRGTPISLGSVTGSPPMALVIQQLARQAGVTLEGLCGSHRRGAMSLTRTAISYVLLRRFGYRASDVAAAFGMSAASVSSMVSRFASRPESSSLVATLVKEVGERPEPPSEECQDYEA